MLRYHKLLTIIRCTKYLWPLKYSKTIAFTHIGEKRVVQKGNKPTVISRHHRKEFKQFRNNATIVCDFINK